MAIILVVDDRAINRTFLATLLESANHKVLQAADGLQALDLVSLNHPDLVICDVLMPRMGGIEFANKVHDDPAVAHTPIIFYTATYRTTEARQLARSCNVSAVLAKPAEPQVILDAVAGALGKVPEPRSEKKDVEEKRSLFTADLDAPRNHALHLRLATLLELHLALSSERDPRAMLMLFCRAAQDILKCTYVSVGMLDSDGLSIKTFEAPGLSEETRLQLASMDPRKGLVGAVIASNKPRRLHTQAGTPSDLGLPDFHPPVNSLLIVPMPVRSAIPLEGWVQFSEKHGADFFSDEDEQIAITLAAQLALTYGNLSLYDEIQKHAADLEIEVVRRTRAQNELAHRIAHDQITGLPRVSLLDDRLRAAFGEVSEHGGKVIVLYADIDRLHSINATRGRAVGDAVLCAVARILTSTAGEHGWVAHVGADEFVLALVDSRGTRNSVELSEEVRRRLEEPILHNNERIYITCSIGVSCFPENGASTQELIEQAENAMLRAKSEGRNASCAFGNEEKSRIREKTAVGLRLGDAIRESQLIVHYQSLIDARDWKILGFEALVRWQSAEFGLLPPARFLPVAEELGLVVDIGRFVLETVCRQARSWLDEGATDFAIAMNVSALHLQRPNFAEEVSAALDGWDLPTRCIELELTENMMLGNVDRAIGTMQDLKARGLRLSLDDFGTGYSSLSYLSRFPIDKLKIDQSFVRNIASSAEAAGICRAIIALGHELGMTVLAEGVETAAQAKYLRTNDCDQLQGFYFGKPVPANLAFESLRQRFVSHQGLAD